MAFFIHRKTLQSAILKENGIKERINSIHADSLVLMLLDPGIYSLLSEKYQINYYWQN